MSLLDHLSETFEKLAHDIGGEAKEARADLLATVRAGFKDVAHEVDAFAAELKTTAVAHPREIFALLRTLQPVLVLRDIALVTRSDDVHEVLARDTAFDVPYAEKMELITNGENFFLGMRNTPRYTRDASNMRIAVRRDDLGSVVGPTVDRTAQAIVAEAGGTLDVVKGLTRVVPARLVGAYFGTPGPSEGELIAWTSTLFQFLFFDQTNDPALRARAVTASAALNAYVDATIAERKAKPRDTDDVLARCLSLQKAGTPGMSDLDIRNDFIGIIVGAIPTTGTAAAFIVDELLNRPAELAAARAAAQAGDDDLLAAYAFEALRFNPMTPGIFRTANRDYTVAKGTSRATTIPKGTSVVAATQSAMFDSTLVDDPDSFRVDRPAYAYLHWSYGLHACFGQYINAVQIPRIVKALLLRDDLRRAPGDSGKLTKDGPYAGSLTVLFS
jgi:cytochrome P450